MLTPTPTKYLPVGLMVLIAPLLTLVPGCFSQNPLPPGQFNNYWALTDNTIATVAAAPSPELTAPHLPNHWTIRSEPSLIRSTISIVRGIDRIKEGADHIDFAVSPEYAHNLRQTLIETRQTLANLRKLADNAASADKKQWTEALARALVSTEHIIRRGTLDAPVSTDEPASLAAEPFLEMIAQYLNQQTGGALLQDLSATDVKQLREILAQLVLRLGFDIAGKQLAPDTRKTAADLMLGTASLEDLQGELTTFLHARIEQAPPATADTQIAQITRALLTWAPKALQTLESFLQQWDKVQYIDVQFIRQPHPAAVQAQVHIRPKKQVRLADVIIGQPALVFQGATRITVMPELPTTGAAVITFDPLDQGAVELRFEGVIYTLFRLFAFPLDDARLREIRVFSHTPAQGTQLISVALFSETPRDAADPRRLLVFQDTREKEIVREPFAVTTRDTRSRQIFNYLTPDARYTFERIKLFDPE